MNVTNYFPVNSLSEEIQTQVSLFRECLAAYREAGHKVMASSSFQTHSIPMLHVISEIDRSIPIVFLQTGFHFPATLTYRDEIAERLGLTILNVESPTPKIAQRTQDGRFFFASDPSYCCYLNKTLPMEPILREYDVWITGVRRDQNANRRSFALEAPGPHGTLRFHPMLDWTSKMIHQYRKAYGLPPHPLEAEGYLSIGCAPCTQKFLDSATDERAGRWAGMKKTECGLHTDLVGEQSTAG
ncbi:MAG: phosphoadenylyl-sulfate reductase [Lewinella sp.]|nr:phosphoadenylyl-sulfate reductase [Lewinella sp.]